MRSSAGGRDGSVETGGRGRGGAELAGEEAKSLPVNLSAWVESVVLEEADRDRPSSVSPVALPEPGLVVDIGRYELGAYKASELEEAGAAEEDPVALLSLFPPRKLPNHPPPPPPPEGEDSFSGSSLSSPLRPAIDVLPCLLPKRPPPEEPEEEESPVEEPAETGIGMLFLACNFEEGISIGAGEETRSGAIDSKGEDGTC